MMPEWNPEAPENSPRYPQYTLKPSRRTAAARAPGKLLRLRTAGRILGDMLRAHTAVYRAIKASGPIGQQAQVGAFAPPAASPPRVCRSLRSFARSLRLQTPSTAPSTKQAWSTSTCASSRAAAGCRYGTSRRSRAG
jgi:hypothetical protein